MAKDFKQIGNPVMNFISSSEEPEQMELQDVLPAAQEIQQELAQPEQQETAAYRKVNVEVRNKRMQILIPQRMANALKELAAQERTSMNELVNEALSRYIEDSKKRRGEV